MCGGRRRRPARAGYYRRGRMRTRRRRRSARASDARLCMPRGRAVGPTPRSPCGLMTLIKDFD